MKNYESLLLKRQEQSEINKKLLEGKISGKKETRAKEKIDALNKQSGTIYAKRGAADKMHELALMEDNFRALVPEIIRQNKLAIDPQNIYDQLASDNRFVTLTVETEDGKSYFLKILKPKDNEDDWERDFNSFAREIQANQYLDKNCPELKPLKVQNTNIDISTIEKDFNNYKITYALIETLPAQKGIGFIHESEQIEQLTAEHARTCIDNLLKQSEISSKAGSGFEQEIYDLQDHFNDFEGYKENTKKILSMFEFEEETEEKYENYVRPLDIINILDFFKEKYRMNSTKSKSKWRTEKLIGLKLKKNHLSAKAWIPNFCLTGYLFG